MKQYTPMIRQYLEIKKQASDAILFFRLGDFYEMFFEDAKVASNILSIALTGRDGGSDEKIPMCGVPYHSSKVYIQRLIDANYKVAIAEQVTQPGDQKGIVQREIVQIITPGTNFDSESDYSNYLASLVFKNRSFHVVYCDVTTGEMYYLNSTNTIEQLCLDLIAIGIKEIVLDVQSSEKMIELIKTSGLMISFVEGAVTGEYQHLTTSTPEFESALNLLLSYLEKTQKKTLSFLRQVKHFENEKYLRLQGSAKTSLDLFENANSKDQYGSLFWHLNQTKTAVGKRCLKRWIEYPLYDLQSIEYRQNMIEKLYHQPIELSQLQSLIAEIYDIERLIVKVFNNTCKPKEINWLKQSFSAILKLENHLKVVNLDHEIKFNYNLISELFEKISKTIVDDIPLQIKDIRYIKQGVNHELDEYLDLLENGEQWLANYIDKQRELTGIKNLKIGYNKVFGYYIEVSKSNQHLILEEYGYVRKQTLANAERYISAELKQRETLILNAQVKISKLESEIFENLIQELCVYQVPLQATSDQVAIIDTICALATVSLKNNYCKPTFNSDGELELIDSRHPVLEKILESGHFVSNDLTLNNNLSGVIITGPNMGGKSTYLRQVALIALMAQMGCYVPCKSAKLPLFDAIYTRIGANDDLVFAKSTFMVEMIEASLALKSATANSLIIFDEIGRGTATYDGMAIAQAIIEYIQMTLKSKLLFATHYHELVELDQSLPNLKNAHVLVDASSFALSFLYKIVDGFASHSYGIQVAGLAGMPKSVLIRAREVLNCLETTKDSQLMHTEVVQFKDDTNDEVISEIQSVDLNQVTPMEALSFIAKLQEKISR